MTRLALPAAVLLAAVAAWLSQSTLAVATPDGPRIALLPVSTFALLVVAFAGLVVVALGHAGVSLAPLSLLLLLILPWLPVPVPDAFLMWSGSIRWLVWFGVGLLTLVPIAARLHTILRSGALGRAIVTRPRLCAGLLAFAIFASSAWQVSPSVPGGDEPHYLVITQSLLLDRDLRIENNHSRGDYRAYYAGTLPPHYIRRGRDGEIYSIHAPGLSVLVAPAFAIAGYHGVVFLLLVIAACGSALAWHLAWFATRMPSAAWFGWAAATLSATAIFHSFAVFPDGPASVLALTGVWALMRAEQEQESGAERVRPWLLHGAALALLPWLHSRLALLAGSLGALVLLRLSHTKNPAAKAVAFLAVPSVSAVCWIGFFVAIYGAPDPSAPYGSSRDFSVAFIPGGLAGLLFDQRFGLIANAPVLLCAGGGLVMMLRRARSRADQPSRDRTPANRRLALELLFVLLPFLLTATSYAMWWGGMSAPARFANPAVPMLAIPCAVAWSGISRRATRVIAVGSLAMTVFISAVLVMTDGGRLAYNTRDALALWLDWASRLVALGEGVPVWFRGRENIFTRDLVVWAAMLGLAWWCARALEAFPTVDSGPRGRPVVALVSILRQHSPGRLGTVVAGLYAAASMLALTIVWSLHGAEPVTAVPAQLELLRRVASERHALTLEVAPPRLTERERVLTQLRIESTLRPGGGPGRGGNEQPLVVFPTLPAGKYRVLIRARRPGGWIMLGVGQDQFALRSERLPWPPSPIEIEFPVDVRALVVRGDEDARRTVRSVAIEPVSLQSLERRLTDRVSRQAVRYGEFILYFLDEGGFPEPTAFWVGGSRQASFVIQPGKPAAGIEIHLRNAPVDNRVTLESGRWREDLQLMPGEERVITIPLAPGESAALVTIASESGFRPSASVPDSRDDRFLGVWISVEGT